jgi:hypothetical protein
VQLPDLALGKRDNRDCSERCTLAACCDIRLIMAQPVQPLRQYHDEAAGPCALDQRLKSGAQREASAIARSAKGSEDRDSG